MNRRSSLALATVVVIRLCLMSAMAKLRNSALRCARVRPNGLSLRLRWRMVVCSFRFMTTGCHSRGVLCGFLL